MRVVVLVPLRLAVLLVLLEVVLLRLALLSVCRAVLLRLAVVAVCVAALLLLLLLLLSSFFIVKNVFVAFEFLNSLVDVCFRFSCASAPSQHHIVLGKTTCHFKENDVSLYKKRRVVLRKTTCHFVVNEGKFCFRGNLYMKSVSSSPQSEKANAGSHCKVTKKSQVSKEIEKKILEGRG